MAKRKADKEVSKKADKTPALKKRAVKVVQDDDEDIVKAVDCKDFVTNRWETTQDGHLAIWQPPEEEDDGPTLSVLPGVIVAVVYDKTCCLVSDSDGTNKAEKKKVS